MRRAGVVLLCAWTAAVAAPVRAQEEADAGEGSPLPVALSVEVGFGGKISLRGYAPLAVGLSTRTFRGRVRVGLEIGRPTEGEALEPVGLGEASLEPGAAVTVRGLLSPDLAARALRAPLRVVARAVDGAPVGEIEARPLVAEQDLLVVLDRRGAAPADFTQLSLGQRRVSTALLSRVADLPTNPLGYSGVSAILLGEMEFERWDARRAHALAGWVAQGGRLIVSLGQGGGPLKQSLLGRALGEGLAPVPFEAAPRPGDAVRLEGLLARLGPVDGLETLHPPLAAVLRPGPGDRVLARDDTRPRGRPFVVRRSHGRGELFLVASDLWSPPFLHTPHVRRLVETFLQARGSSGWQHRTGVLFPELKGKRMPARFGPVFALLILYALLAGPGVYFLLRARGRGLLLWVAIPGLTAVFSLLVPLYRLFLSEGESALVGVRLLEARAGQSVGVETIDVLLFSGSPDPKRFTLAGPDATGYAVRPVPFASSASPLFGEALAGNGEGGLEATVPVALWGTRYLSFARTVPAPRCEGLVSLDSSDAGPVADRLRLRYGGPRALRDPVLVYSRRSTLAVHPLGERLAVGAEFDRSLDDVLPASAYKAPDKGLAGAVVVRLLRANILNDRRAYLIGWYEDECPVKAEPNVRSRGCPVVQVVSLPLRFARGVPFGVAERTVEAATIARVDSDTLLREVRTRLVLPGRGAGALRGLRLRVASSVQGASALQGLQLFGRWQGEEGPVLKPIDLGRAEVQAKGRSLVLRLTDPNRWCSPDGELLFVQRFERRAAEPDRLWAAGIDVAAEWEEEPKAPSPRPGEGW
ncbi:MAG: hypothetical protein D6731_12505 [Planctomycetota bacterium]|nr:MAG: hypothetical protein D6731_12505 [Planctomycetota bacterium]